MPLTGTFKVAMPELSVVPLAASVEAAPAQLTAIEISFPATPDPPELRVADRVMVSP
jgi:hypothetical protein